MLRDLTKEMLVKDIAEHTGIPRSTVAEVLHQLNATVKHTAQNHTYSGIRITDLLHLGFVKKAERSARNPATQAPIKVPARFVAKLRNTNALEAALHVRLGK